MLFIEEQVVLGYDIILVLCGNSWWWGGSCRNRLDFVAYVFENKNAAHNFDRQILRGSSHLSIVSLGFYYNTEVCI